jgi:hypothetical protein
MINPFNPTSQLYSQEKRTQREFLRQWLCERLLLSEDVQITINELACVEPGCPPIETIFLFLVPCTKTKQFKLHKPLLEIVPADLEKIAVFFSQKSKDE